MDIANVMNVLDEILEISNSAAEDSQDQVYAIRHAVQHLRDQLEADLDRHLSKQYQEQELCSRVCV
jgi:hypothetical protein